MNDFSLIFVTRYGCHLCEDALPVVNELCTRMGLTLEVVQMEDHDELVRLYAYRIPVVLGPDGEVLAESRIEARPLKRAIRGALRSARRRSV